MKQHLDKRTIFNQALKELDDVIEESERLESYGVHARTWLSIQKVANRAKLLRELILNDLEINETM